MYKSGVIINDLLFTPSGGRRVLSLLKLVTVNIEGWADASFHFYQNKWKGLCQVPAGSSDLLTAQTAASDDVTRARWQHSCRPVQPHFLSPGRRGDTASIFLQISELIVAHLKSPNICWAAADLLFLPLHLVRRIPCSHVIVPTSHVRAGLNRKDLNVFTLLSGF